MIEDAASIAPSSPFAVSELWREGLLLLDYIRELSDAQLQYIRTHTSLITGAYWADWVHHPARFASSDEEREKLDFIRAYLDLVKDLPETYWGDEPVPNQAMRLLGLPFRGRLISQDILRYQRAITNLYDAGLLGKQLGEPLRYLEIGGGYGGFAHQIGRMVPSSTYIIVDLPEMLFWSAVFLRLNNPSQPIYLYDSATFAAAQFDQILATHKFVLLPHYLLERLESFPIVDVAINMLSMQEMSEGQIRVYCDFLTRHLRGWLYSENFARHIYNKQLTRDLYDIFAEYFLTLPAMKLTENPGISHHLWQIYTYLLTPKTHPADYAPIRQILRGGNYAFTGPPAGP
jgi:hypothetical protein